MYQTLCGAEPRDMNGYRSLILTFLCLLFAALLASPATAAERSDTAMTLGAAIQLALSENPDLQVYRFRETGLQGLAHNASLRPPIDLSAEAENIGGSGDYGEFESAEFTLALSSVIELGDKREARIAAVEAQRQVIAGERQTRALDLMGEVTRRYVEVVATQARLDLALNARSLAQEVVQSVEHRARAGAAPEAESLRARANLTQAELVVREGQNRLRTARLSLSVLWGDMEPDFVRVAGNLESLGDVGNFDSLYQRAIQNPAIEIFASEERLREAEFQLATSQSNTDIGWSVGIRQYQETNDTAFVAGLSIPLVGSKRNSGAAQSARAARDETSLRRESALLNLRASLFDAYQQRKLGIETASSLRSDVIPLLQRALQQTQEAYENGRYSYQEWAAAQQELLSAEHALIAAASAALHSGATIEQLTSEPLLPPLEPGSSNAEQETE